jgi:hypothetical protein
MVLTLLPSRRQQGLCTGITDVKELRRQKYGSLYMKVRVGD